MMMHAFTTLLACAAALTASAAPAPAPMPASLAARDVWDPRVLYPHTGTVWIAGNHHNVTWSLADEPVNITNSIGMIVLIENGEVVNGPGGFNAPLASGFDVRLGRIPVQVPQVKAGTYQIILFGDSGNTSEDFSIVEA